MIKILHVISDTNIGGAGVHLCNLLSQIDRSFFEISVCLPQNNLLAPKIRALDLPVIETKHGGDRSADLLAVPELISVLRRRAPHILHTHSALYARLAGCFCHVPVLINTRHCAEENQSISPLRHLAAAGLEKILGGHTVATAHYVENELIREGTRADSIHVICNGSRPLPLLSPIEKSEIRQSLGLFPHDFTVGMVARLEKGKGHDTFLGAAALCIQKNPNVRFLIVGDGSRARELRTLAARLGLGDRVIFTGFCADVAPIMNILHLNVNCSEISETSSLSLSEGMSVGAVPVVSNCGGNAFMAGAGQNGIVFPVGNKEILAAHILSLAQDRPRLAQLSERAKQRFQQDFTADAMTRKTEALYRSLWENAPRRLYSEGEQPSLAENSREK